MHIANAECSAPDLTGVLISCTSQSSQMEISQIWLTFCDGLLPRLEDICMLHRICPVTAFRMFPPGMRRFCQMMWRLNFLVTVTCVVLDNSYMLYYICPMHTIFTVFVYACLALGAKYNSSATGIWLK